MLLRKYCWETCLLSLTFLGQRGESPPSEVSSTSGVFFSSKFLRLISKIPSCFLPFPAAVTYPFLRDAITRGKKRLWKITFAGGQMLCLMFCKNQRQLCIFFSALMLFLTQLISFSAAYVITCDEVNIFLRVTCLCSRILHCHGNSHVSWREGTRFVSGCSLPQVYNKQVAGNCSRFATSVFLLDSLNEGLQSLRDTTSVSCPGFLYQVPPTFQVSESDLGTSEWRHIL